MILYFSSDGRSFGDPSVVLGDNANVMLTFWHSYQKQNKTRTGSSFTRLKRARRRNTGEYKAYKDFHVVREKEREFAVLPLDASRKAQIIKNSFKYYSDKLLHKTPLLFSLVNDYKPPATKNTHWTIVEIVPYWNQHNVDDPHDRRQSTLVNRHGVIPFPKQKKAFVMLYHWDNAKQKWKCMWEVLR